MCGRFVGEGRFFFLFLLWCGLSVMRRRVGRIVLAVGEEAAALGVERC